MPLPAHTLVTLAKTMFDDKSDWRLCAAPEQGKPIRQGRLLTDVERAAFLEGLVVEVVVRYPRADVYGVPTEATLEGARLWLCKEVCLLTASLHELKLTAVDSGDDTPAECVITVRVATECWPLDVTEFDDFAKLVRPGKDISRFKDSFSHQLDINGVIAADQLGFHFSLDGDEPGAGYTEQAKDMLETFKPSIIYVGNKALQAELLALGYQSIVHSYYEDGGLAVVMRVPAGSHVLPLAQRVKRVR